MGEPLAWFWPVINVISSEAKKKLSKYLNGNFGFVLAPFQDIYFFFLGFLGTKDYQKPPKIERLLVTLFSIILIWVFETRVLEYIVPELLSTNIVYHRYII